MKRKLNWHPSRGDIRDHKYETLTTSLPPYVDMRSSYTRIYDQGSLGSCTANAAAGLVSFQRVKQDLRPYHASRLFIYYEERSLEGSVSYDAGAYLRDAVKVLYNEGACTEHVWDYEQSFKEKPSVDAYQEASGYKIREYLKLDNTNINALKSCLADGFAFMFGFTVYQSFESTQANETGMIPMPSKNESVLGGHAVFGLGYDDSIQSFICRNSWGKEWGDAGHFYMPYEYLTNPQLASDFWTIKLV